MGQQQPVCSGKCEANNLCFDLTQQPAYNVKSGLLEDPQDGQKQGPEKESSAGLDDMRDVAEASTGSNHVPPIAMAKKESDEGGTREMKLEAIQEESKEASEETPPPRESVDEEISKAPSGNGTDAAPDNHTEAPSENIEGTSRKSSKMGKNGKGNVNRSSSILYANGEATRRSDKVDQMGEPFPPRPAMCKLSKKIYDKLELLFKNMDGFGKNAITHEDALQYFKGTFKSLSADAMFKEVDVDQSGVITADEFIAFWVQVKSAGYKEKDMLDEINELLEGAPWVDWKDDRNTEVTQEVKWPKRPLLCKLSTKGWNKCKELFLKIDPTGRAITKEDAMNFFQGSFKKLSVDGMFNEIDEKDHGRITPEAWMAFWVQVRTSGYKEVEILTELNNLIEGGQWVDWDDNRETAGKNRSNSRIKALRSM